MFVVARMWEGVGVGDDGLLQRLVGILDSASVGERCHLSPKLITLITMMTDYFCDFFFQNARFGQRPYPLAPLRLSVPPRRGGAGASPFARAGDLVAGNGSWALRPSGGGGDGYSVVAAWWWRFGPG